MTMGGLAVSSILRSWFDWLTMSGEKPVWF